MSLLVSTENLSYVTLPGTFRVNLRLNDEDENTIALNVKPFSLLMCLFFFAYLLSIINILRPDYFLQIDFSLISELSWLS